MTVCLGARPRNAEAPLARARRRRSECGRMVEEPLRSPRDVRPDADIRLDRAQAVLSPEVRSIGTIEGELEGLIIGKPNIESSLPLFESDEGEDS